jgi:DNA mismatch repair protein PMS2
MVGDALDTPQMTRLLKGLAAVEQPWNCPHGRPTMRHLADVTASLKSSAETAAAGPL